MNFRNKIIPTATFAIAVYILASQLIIPLWQYRAQQNLVNPVAGAYTTFWDQRRDLLILEEPQTPPPPFFYLSIPKIELEEVPVETNSTKAPDQNLIHIKGTALPGSGQTSASQLKIPIVVSGHSVSPLFFNSKDPRTYFTGLPKLQTGDEIEVNFQNKNYKYSVEKKEVVKPKDLWEVISKEAALNQTELVLFTCVPPGLRTNRLIIFAQALENQQN